jgi:hypothetical protein
MQNQFADVATLVDRLEREHPLPGGDEERFLGYGVMADPFQSGDLLAMRRFPASSLGAGYTSVWHRSPEGQWTFWSDRPPLQACPRYFGSDIAHAVSTPITVRWTGPLHLEIEIPAADLRWAMDLESTRVTRTLNRLGQLLPERAWRSPYTLALIGRFAARLLHAGRLGLSGRVPNGQAFIANPQLVWIVGSSSASIAGRDLGPMGPLAEQTHLGDFWIPQRALFAIGRSFFEPVDPSRHRLVPEITRPAPVA